MQRRSDLDTFYGLLAELESRIGGRRLLRECHECMNWPERGVYFFFERGEIRDSDPSTFRVVRVGISSGLWKRISQHRGSQHRGTTNPSGGDHRVSRFRLLSGEALMTRDPTPQIESWGRKDRKGDKFRVTPEIKTIERPHEVLVSKYLGAMSLLFVSVPDASGSESRRFIERNAIALLSNYHKATLDQSSPQWLGQFSGRDRVRRSGLWNSNHVADKYDPAFLGVLEGLVRKTSST